MNLWRHRYRAWIVPYAEGTLDPGRRAKLEAWLARDPALAAEAEAEQRVVARLRAAVQSAGSAPGAKNLWPGIQSRLEPRRSLVRPLILVGGLSAAATSLAWATLWGPLGHSPPPSRVVVVQNSGTPNVIVVGPSAGRHHGAAVRRVRRGTHTFRRPAVSHLTPGGAAENGTGAAQDDRLLARGDAASPVESGDAAPTTPRFVPGGGSHLHLATNVRPVGHDEDQSSAPPASGDASADLPTPAPDGASIDKGRITMRPGTEGPARAERPRRHWRHTQHKRRAGADPSAQEHPVPAPPETAAPAGETVAHPKAGSKPVD